MLPMPLSEAPHVPSPLGRTENCYYVAAMTRILRLLAVSVLLAPFALADASPNIVLRGEITHRDHQTYKLLPFTVPGGTTRITIDFSYTGRDQRTVIDLGLLAPDGFRGWAGGRPGPFTLSETDASPSYLPGKIVPGTWNLLLGIPNIRPNVTATYQANVYFSRAEIAVANPSAYPVLSREARWYRGDLHMHTGHSDGSCKSQTGKSVPCPEFFTVDAAARRGLDFIAITDHNTTSHYEDMRQLQPYFDRVLLIPGREITTFQGHANVFGTTAFIDFRVTSPQVPTWDALLERVRATAALVSINHPNDPTGESCMGCGWTPSGAVDMNRVDAVEAINGIDAETPRSGIPFWQQQLNRGYRLTAIGGSDNHNALAPLPGPGSIGYPTTAIYAAELSVPAILDSIRGGHVFLDVQGSDRRLLEMTAKLGAKQVMMGDVLQAGAGQSVAFTVHVAQAAGGKLEIVADGSVLNVLADSSIGQDDQSFTFPWKSDGHRHWIRANVRGADGRLLLVGNPIYINFGDRAESTR